VITDYIEAAMNHASYELMGNDRFFGSIPLCRGVWADGDNLENCRSTLLEVMQGWILVRVRHGLDLPVVDGIDLNPKPVHAETD
jgi:predicted RNase H-like HicB family nuclease